MNLESKINELKNQLDLAEPNIGHFNRFEAKLKGNLSKKKKPNYYKFIAIAASLVLLISIGFNVFQANNKGVELADISPKMKETQTYFATVIQEELTKIEKQKNTNNTKIINDAMSQLNNLKIEYQNLTIELKNNKNKQALIFAMIANYQQRIEVLQNLLQDLSTIKNIKNNNYENNNI